MKVFITREIPEIAVNMLLKNNIDVVEYGVNKPVPVNELIKNAKDCDAVISLLTDKIDKNIMDNLPKCKIIANYAVGYNNIDVDYAKKKNIVVTNTPDMLTDATADLAAGLVLACSRNFYSAEEMVRKNQFKGWGPKLFLGYELRNKVLGIIGAGRIGQETAKRLKAFGVSILYYNRSRKPEFENETGAQKVNLNVLLKKSDIISIHLPLNEKSKYLISREKLDLLKTSAVLVNTSRGEIVEEKYLIEMLKKNRIFAAGFDVYEGEPSINKELLKLKNVCLLPHIGSATIEARTKMAELCALNVINVLNNRPAITPVK